MNFNLNKYAKRITSPILGLLPKHSARSNTTGLSKGLLMFFSVFFLLVSISCSTQKETIKDRNITITVPAIHSEIKELDPVNVDILLEDAIEKYATDSTYYEGKTFTPRGDFIKVKVKLKTKETKKPEVIIDVKPHSVDTTVTDTTRQVFVKENKSLSDYFIYLIIFAVVIAVITLIIKIKR
jgi:hypothetical protein